MKILITGGAGFIGSHITKKLLQDDHEVLLFDNLDPQVHEDNEKDDQGWPQYLEKNVERINGDICSPRAVAKAIKNVDAIIHLAAKVGVGQSMTDIINYTKVNSLGTAVLLEALTKGKHSVSRLVVASSMSIYGEGLYKRADGTVINPQFRSLEQLMQHSWELNDEEGELSPIPTSEQKIIAPNSIYAINKRDHEEMCLVVGRSLHIPTIALRLFNAYGPNQALSNPYTGVAAIFISRLLNNKPPMIFEDGLQMRDFVHVSDVASAFVNAVTSKKELYKAYNVGSGKSITIKEIAQTLIELMDKKNTEPEILNKYRVGDIRHCFSDISLIKKDLDFSPKVNFLDGMKELVNWVSEGKTAKDKTYNSFSELARHNLLL